MGEIKVNGVAKREVECDVMHLSFEFSTQDYTVAKTVERLNEEVEQALKVFEREGIPASSFEGGEIDVDDDYYVDDESKRVTYCIAKRKITLKCKLDVKLENFFLNLIASNNLNIYLDEAHFVSNETTIKKELLKEAMADSKAKAEMIAECAREEIVGIKEVMADKGILSRFNNDDTEFEDAPMNFGSIKMRSGRADDLKPLTKNLSESVTVIWKLKKREN